MTGLCGTYATRRASSLRDAPFTAMDPIRSSPSKACSPATARRTVVLPAPFGPIKATQEPPRTDRSRPATTLVPLNETDRPQLAMGITLLFPFAERTGRRARREKRLLLRSESPRER